MITIKKQAEPRGLKTAKRDNKLLTYAQFSEEGTFKDAFKELRLSLLAEQGYICCYCQKKISFSDAVTGRILMKAEHFIPKRGTQKDESKQVDYNNLLAACLGNQDSDNPNHCDSSKEDMRLRELPNPAEIRQSNFDSFLKYKLKEKEGEVVVIATDLSNQELKDDINKRLNLNEQNLKNRRFAVWKAIWRKVNKTGKTDIRQVKEILAIYKYDDALEPSKRDFKEFCGFIVQWYSAHYKDELQKIA
jgi:uncharacterized protein (TIGR02646 family)